MKVLQIITKSNWGGAQKHVFDLCLELKKQNVDVVLACGIIPGKAPLAERIRLADIEVLPIHSLGRDINLLKDIVSFFEIIKIIKKNNPDVVHVHSSKIGGLGSLAARLCGVKKIIFTAHGTPFKEDRLFIVRFILKTLSYITVLLSTDTICVSNAVYNAYPKIFVKKKLQVVHNGMSSPIYFDTEESRDRLSIKTKESELIIGTIAELHKNKGLTYLLESAKKIDVIKTPFQIHILGGGELHEKLAEYIEDNELSNSVYLHGFIAEASHYLKAFDIFVLPSINEGLPYVLLEAGLASLPVIATNVGGIPELIINEETGLLVPSKDPQTLSISVQKLLLDENLRKNISGNLYKKISTEYDLEHMVEKIVAIYTTK